MKGLELAREYFDEYGRPLIENELEEYKEYIAAGLVGEGDVCCLSAERELHAVL